MFGIETIAFYVGVGLCMAAAFAVVSWAGQTFSSMTGVGNAHDESVRALRESIRAKASSQPSAQEDGSWNGYRNFVVSRVVPECEGITSVYLQPEDEKPIPGFKPGQHITLRFLPKGKTKSVVRCYSLSDAPGRPWYRITVKHVSDRGNNKGPGVVSTIINKETKVGDVIPIKAPSGHFFLDEESDNVAVLLGGGIGITPMVSMMEHIIQLGNHRSVVVVHGVRHSKEQAFAEHLRTRAQQFSNVHLVNCYSQPGPDDVRGEDYQFEGFATVDLLKSMLPNHSCQFYLCGPPPFMQSLHDGLLEWGIKESKIAYEQFGPSTIRKKTTAEDTAKHDEPDPVTFSESDEIVLWSANHQNLLELAEAHDIPIESGCRAGSCGTCETAILNGKVRYLNGQEVSCNPGCCLPCVAVPDGPLELEA